MPTNNKFVIREMKAQDNLFSIHLTGEITNFLKIDGDYDYLTDIEAFDIATDFISEHDLLIEWEGYIPEWAKPLDD